MAINNCVAFAQRDKKLEEFLNNKENNASLAKEALDHLDNSIYDTRSSDYKKHMFYTSIKSAVEELSPVFPKAMLCTLTAVPHSPGIFSILR